MNEMDKTSSRLLLNRFYNCSDSLVNEIQITYDNEVHPEIRISILSRDSWKLPEDEWAILVLTCKQVSDYCFEENRKSYNNLLSNGICILHEERRVGIDFGYLPSEPEDINELKNSRFFVIAQSIMWDVTSNEGDITGDI